VPTIIEIEDLYHSFPDGWDALNGVSLSIASGEYVALIGPNGSGKTTLAKHLNGLLKPTSGRVVVAGLDTREVDVGTLARKVGYVFQNPDHQIFGTTVTEELAFAPVVQGVSADKVKERVEFELNAFGLQDVAGHPPAVLPPGLRRKVAIASVLTARPAVLILDEPSVGLDAREQEELFTRIADYNTIGNTILLISHDMGLVTRWAQRCLLMTCGTIIADGTPSQVFYDVTALQQAGMKPPPLVALARSLADLSVPQGLLDVNEFGCAYIKLLKSRQ